MKTTLGCLRRADQDFAMIADGDHIAVGVSGGKDSLLLLHALCLYRLFSHKHFTVVALMLDMGFPNFNASSIQTFCEKRNVTLIIQHTDIAHVLFEVRGETHPCALCAKMRRGMLNELAIAQGANKLALGHHREDALETFLMSLFYEGRLHTFHPVTHLSRTGMTVIRPLIYLPEKHIIHLSRTIPLPVMHNDCPADGHTARQRAKDLMHTLTKDHPDLPALMLSALRNTKQYGLWDAPFVGGDSDV